MGETVGIKHPRTAIGAGGNIVKMIEPIIVALARHGEILHLAVAHMPDCGMYAPPATAWNLGFASIPNLSPDT